MFSAPAAVTVRDRTWQAALVVTLGVVGFTFFPLAASSYQKWLQPDYSHGFLVPLFAGMKHEERFLAAMADLFEFDTIRP